MDQQPQGQQPPQAAPRNNISPFLQPHEVQAILAAGENPAEFAVIEQVVDQMQIGIGTTPQQKLVAVVQMMLIVPTEILPLPTSQIVGADGHTGANSKLQTAFTQAAPPRVRIPIRRTALSDQIRTALLDYEAQDRAARLGAFAPPPTE